MKAKMSNTMAVFREYEKRFLNAQKELNESLTKEEIVETIKSVLGINEEMIPNIHNLCVVSERNVCGIIVQELLFESWDDFYGTATLYLPKTNGEKLPFVFLCIGHGEDGRKTESYVQMAYRLARLGMAVLIPDCIGRGARKPQGHSQTTIAPFYFGYTLQGLILCEALALIRYMQKDSRFDANRFGACGNSGGGTLTTLLCALAPELSVIATSGYPSEFSFILQKERSHCACNLLPGIIPQLEMWQLLGCFAPKPLLIEQGINDNLIPHDLCKRCHRKVRNVYVSADAEESLKLEISNTEHSWQKDDIAIISRFLAEELLNIIPDDEFEFIFENQSDSIKLPFKSLDVIQLCEKLSGKKYPENIKLEDIFPPKFRGEQLNAETIISNLGYGDIMRLLAQWECVLGGDN